jgi:hypothetical protein
LISLALLVVPLAAWLAIPSPRWTRPAAPTGLVRNEQAPSLVTSEPEAPRDPLSVATAAPTAPTPAAATPAEPRAQEPGATGIAGRVVDESGAAVTSFRLAVGPRTHVVEDAEGAFTLMDVAPGRYDLVASVRDGRTGRAERIDVTEGAVTADVRIVVLEGVTVTGNVVDAVTRAPIATAHVLAVLNGKAARMAGSSDGGEYTIVHAPTEPFELRIVATGYETHVVPAVKASRPGEPVRIDAALERPAPEAH